MGVVASIYTALGFSLSHAAHAFEQPDADRGTVLRVGLTGGVACGKSTVGQMLAARGAHFLKADTLAHQLYAPGEPTYDAVVQHFGGGILNPDGTINRAQLADAAFPGRIAELNAIVHPAVIDVQNKWMAEVARTEPNGVAVIEAALIIEAGAARDFDKLIVVTCDLEQKIARYALRAHISHEAARVEILRRSAAQLSDDEKASHSDYIIDNSGSLEDLAHYVEVLWAHLTEFADQPGDRRPDGSPLVQ